MKYALAAIELAIGVALAAGMIVGLWWGSRDKNALKKYIVWECVCLVLIVIAFGALAWTAIDYAVIQDMH